MTDTPTPFKTLIETRMEELNFTPDDSDDFALHAGLPHSIVFDLLNGLDQTKVTLTLEALANLSHALETPLHDLVYMLEPDAYGAIQRVSDRYRLDPVTGNVTDIIYRPDSGEDLLICYTNGEDAQTITDLLNASGYVPFGVREKEAMEDADE